MMKQIIGSGVMAGGGGGGGAPEATFTDDFNRANQTLETSADWGSHGSMDLAVVDNHVESASSGVGVYDWQSALGSVDHWASAVVADASTATIRGLASVRRPNSSASGQGYFAELTINPGGDADLALVRMNTDFTFTTLGSQALAGAAVGDVVRVSALGDALKVYLNEVEQLSVTDATHAGGLHAGICADNGSVNLDDWKAGEL